LLSLKKDIELVHLSILDCNGIDLSKYSRDK